jgi:hypothetical protein
MRNWLITWLDGSVSKWPTSQWSAASILELKNVKDILLVA